MSLGVSLAIALAGGLGAAARYIIDTMVSRRISPALPWGTWTVNITGAGALGLLVGGAGQVEISDTWLLIVGGGFLGAYTTFSTWMLETLRLIEQRAWRAAMANLLGSATTGVVAAAAGIAVARWMFA